MLRAVMGHRADREPPWRTEALDRHLVSLVDPTSPEAEQYRTLRHVIEGLHATKRVIAVTSAIAGDGKTTTAINLAGALAHAPEANILIVDLDLRNPFVGNRLGLTSQSPGMVDLLLDPDLTLGDVVRRHPTFRLSVAPAGRVMAVPYEVLKSPRLAEMLDQARRQYSYVIVDVPPLMPIPDSRLIADRVDGILMVISAHRTPRPLVADALNVLQPAKVIGIVFNGDDRLRSGYYGYYGYGQHRRSRRRGRAADPASEWV